MSTHEITIDFNASNDFDSEHCIGASILHHAFAPICNAKVNDCTFDVNYFNDDAVIVVQHDYRTYDKNGFEVEEVIDDSNKMSSKLETFKLSYIDSLVLESKISMLDDDILIAEPVMKFSVDTAVAYRYERFMSSDFNNPRRFTSLLSKLYLMTDNELIGTIHDKLAYREILHEMRYERDLSLERIS